MVFSKFQIISETFKKRKIQKFLILEIALQQLCISWKMLPHEPLFATHFESLRVALGYFSFWSSQERGGWIWNSEYFDDFDEFVTNKVHATTQYIYGNTKLITAREGRNLWVGPVHVANPWLSPSNGFGTWTSNYRNFVLHSVEFRPAYRYFIMLFCSGLQTVFLLEHRTRIRGDLNFQSDVNC